MPCSNTPSFSFWSYLDGLAAVDVPGTEHIVLCRAAAAAGQNLSPKDEERLAGELLTHMKRLVVVLPRDAGPRELSEAGAAYLERFGAPGSKASRAVMEKAGERAASGGEHGAWTGWIEGGENGARCRFLEILARLLLQRWSRRVDLERKQTPAIYGYAYDARSGLRWGNTEWEESPPDGQARLLSGDGIPVALFMLDANTDLVRLRTAIRKELGVGLLFERTWRALPRLVHVQAIDGINPCTRLVFDGVGGFAEAASVSSGRDRAMVLPLLELLQAWRGNRRDIPPMLSYWFRQAAGGSCGRLSIDVGEALVPGYATGTALPPKWAGRHERFLLPVLELPYLGWAGRRQHARLAALQWELLVAMRARVVEYPTGFVYTREEKERACDAAGVKMELASQALRVWTAGPSPWLVERGDGLRLRDPAADGLFLRAVPKILGGKRGGSKSAARRGGKGRAGK